MKKQIAIAAIAVCGLAGTTLADTVDVAFVGQGQGRNVRTTLNGDTSTHHAGQLIHNFSNGNGIFSGLSGDQITFCAELAQHTNGDAASFEARHLEDGPDANPMGDDVAQAIRNVWVYANGSQFDDNGTAFNKSYAAAFQLAMWEILTDYDGTLASLDIESGDMSATRGNGAALNGTIQGLLADFFAAAAGDDFDLGGLKIASNGQFQDQMVMVPLPAPLALGLAGLGAVALRRRRNRTA